MICNERCMVCVSYVEAVTIFILQHDLKRRKRKEKKRNLN
jgi:hypothetical protein